MAEIRLGDVIDDHCIKCRRITNHSIVSLVNGQAAKVRCRTCYFDHDYRHEQAPPSKRELKKQELFKEVLATMAPGTEPGNEDVEAGPDTAEVVVEPEEDEEPVAEAVPDEPAPARKTRARRTKN